MEEVRGSFHRSTLEEWEPKWMSFTKLSICYIVIHVNSTFFILLKNKILNEYQFPCPLFLVFTSQLISLLISSIICIIRRHQFTQNRSDLNFWKPKIYIKKIPLIQFALMALSDSVGNVPHTNHTFIFSYILSSLTILKYVIFCIDIFFFSHHLLSLYNPYVYIYI